LFQRSETKSKAQSPLLTVTCNSRAGSAAATGSVAADRRFYAVQDSLVVATTDQSAKRLMPDESVATSACLSMYASLSMSQFYSDPQTGVPLGKTQRCNVRSKI